MVHFYTLLSLSPSSIPGFISTPLLCPSGVHEDLGNPSKTKEPHKLTCLNPPSRSEVDQSSHPTPEDHSLKSTTKGTTFIPFPNVTVKPGGREWF